MKKVNYIHIQMMLDHIALQVFRKVNYKIAIITPNADMATQIHRNLVVTIKSIDSSIFSRLTDRNILMINNSQIITYSAHQQNIFRGIQFNSVFLTCNISQPLLMEMIPAVSGDMNSIIYQLPEKCYEAI